MLDVELTSAVMTSRLVTTTPIQQEGTLDTQPPYGRRGAHTNSGIPGSKAPNLSSYGIQYFNDDINHSRGHELEQGEIPRSRVGPCIGPISNSSSGVAITLSTGPPSVNRIYPFSGPCCALPFPVTQTHNIGRTSGTSNNMIISCAGCEKPILDKFLLNVLERPWHANCVRCFDCNIALIDKCFSRESKLFCRSDFFRRYGTKCGGCSQGISPSDLVRKARDKVFHLNCFTCMVCRKQLSTGEELYVLDDNKFICKDDYISGKNSQDLGYSGSEDDDDEESNSSTSGSLMKHHLHAQLHPSTPEANNNSLSAGDLQGSLGHGSLVDSKQEDSEDQGSLDGDPETRDSQIENKSPDDANSGSKRRGPRTTIKAKQLEVLKTAFSQTPKPTRHIREQLAKETGLPMRVIQVWFQNKRSKERRLKQLTSMGRGPFFGGARKMRGFPMNLSPGLDDSHPGFPYFATADGKFEFGYGAPGFHPDFFPGHHGPPGSLPFNPAGGPMDGPMSSMGPEFGNIGQDPPQGFMPQLPQPPHSEGQLISQRSSPSDFMSSQGGGSASSGGFSDGPPLQNEGLVW